MTTEELNRIQKELLEIEGRVDKLVSNCDKMKAVMIEVMSILKNHPDMPDVILVLLNPKHDFI